MKGTISEMEVASFRERAEAALRQKAQRGELFQRVPIGYVKTVEDRIEKDPDARVATAIELIFRSLRRWQARGRSICGWISSRSCCPSRADPMTRGRSSGKPARTLPC